MVDRADEVDATLPSGPGGGVASSTPPTRPSSPGREGPPELTGRFGRYRIMRSLGGGAMGAVYLAHDEQLDRPVALKIPRIAADDDPEMLERFVREARAAARLTHPNLCPVFDAGQIDGQHYLTMGFVEGRSLADRLREGPLPQREAAAIVRTLALALDVAHAKGIIHRDLKPANVMVDDSGQPIIVDFGLARRSSKDAEKLTRPGTIVGTPTYMSPEQVEGDPGRIGPPSDIYAIGVILYELLTGKPPFAGSIASVLGQVMNKEPERPCLRRPDLDARLEAICLKAMAKDPAQRHARMADVAGELEAVIAAPAAAVPVREPAAETTMSKGSVAPPERPPVWMPAAIGGALVVVLGLWALRGGTPGTGPGPSSSPGTESAPAVAGPAVPAPAESTATGASAASVLVVRPRVRRAKPPRRSERGRDASPAAPPSLGPELAGADATVRALALALFDPEHSVREKAAHALKGMRAVAAADTLARRVAVDEEPRLTGHQRDAMVGALKALAPDKAVPAVREAFGSDEAVTRKWAAELLAAAKDKGCIDELAERVATDDVYESIHYDKDPPLVALIELAPDRAGPALIPAFGSRHSVVRRWAAGKLAERNYTAAARAVEERVATDAIYESVHYDKDPALAALHVLAMERCGPALMAAIMSKEDQVRRWAINELAKHRYAAAAGALEKRVGSEEGDPSIHYDREPSLAALEEIAPTRITPVLLAALRSATPAVRKWACEKLAVHKDPAAVPGLVALVKTEAQYSSVHYDKQPPLEALETLAPDQVAPALEAAMQSKEAAVRAWAIEEIAKRRR